MSTQPPAGQTDTAPAGQPNTAPAGQPNTAPGGKTQSMPSGAMELDLIDSASFSTDQEVPLVPVQIVSRPALLQQISGPGNGTMFRLETDRIVIGRNPDSDILVQSSSLSRHHLRLHRYQGGYRAVDLDSSNGVYLNEIRIHSAALRDGDTLQLGNAAFVYHEGQ